MPYITNADRQAIDPVVGWGGARTPGELNYLLTTTCVEYLAEKGKSYQTINDIVGALEGAKLEFYRRIAAPYEDVKIAVNGDVY